MPCYTEVAAIRPVPATGYIARPIPGRPDAYEIFAYGTVYARVTRPLEFFEVRLFRHEIGGGFYPDTSGAPDHVANCLTGALKWVKAWHEADAAEDDWVDVDTLVERAIENSNDQWAWMQGDSDPRFF